MDVWLYTDVSVNKITIAQYEAVRENITDEKSIPSSGYSKTNSTLHPLAQMSFSIRLKSKLSLSLVHVLMILSDHSVTAVAGSLSAL